MKAQKQEVRTISVRLILLASLLVLPGLAFSTEQAQQRRQGRDVKQDTRQGSRDTKADCRAANQQSNAGCRQDKRETKQGGRQQARDIKY
jgi:hypothetical protein